MRIDPISREKFKPANPNHMFASSESFHQFVEELDPLEEFTPEKRNINWPAIERVDPITNEKFTALHPAQRYAPRNVPESDS